MTFKVGDTVRLKDQKKYGGHWDGPMNVTEVDRLGNGLEASHPTSCLGWFTCDEVEVVPEYFYLLSEDLSVFGRYDSIQEALDDMNSTDEDLGDLTLVKVVGQLKRKVTYAYNV